MVILGGLELVAAGYLLNRHYKNKEEKDRLEAEAAALEEQHYRIHSPNSAGPGRRRRYSDDRDHRHRRRHSPDRKHTYDKRRRDGEPKPSNARLPPPPPQPHPHQQPFFPPTGIPQEWRQGQPPQYTQQRMSGPPPAQMSYQQFPASQPYLPNPIPPAPPAQRHPDEQFAYPPEKLLRPGSPNRGRSSSAPAPVPIDPYRHSPSSSRVRIAVPGEDELTVPGGPPPQYHP